jgi:hypothetical protein
MFRKLRWNNNINERRSEDKMVGKFKNLFGPPEKLIVGFGDWGERNTNMKFKEPSKGKGMRKLLQRHGYNVFLVDEYNSSQMCSNGCGILKQIYKSDIINDENLDNARQNPIHKLLRCEICCNFWNRNVNACLNIHDVVDNVLKKIERPKLLQRKKCNEDDLNIEQINKISLV